MPESTLEDQNHRSNGLVVIAVEGLDGVGKSTSIRSLNEKIGRQVIRTPDSRLREVRDIFDSASMHTRNAFYNASNHLASDAIRSSDRNIFIVDRYVPSTFAAAHSHGLLTLDEIYEKQYSGELWEGLVVPDHIFHLRLNEAERVNRITGRGESLNRDELILMDDTCFREKYTTVLDLFATDVIQMDDLTPLEIGSIMAGCTLCTNQ